MRHSRNHILVFRENKNVRIRQNLQINFFTITIRSHATYMKKYKIWHTLIQRIQTSGKILRFIQQAYTLVYFALVFLEQGLNSGRHGTRLEGNFIPFLQGNGSLNAVRKESHVKTFPDISERPAQSSEKEGLSLWATGTGKLYSVRSLLSLSDPRLREVSQSCVRLRPRTIA
jgi:hypothetical protein